jgi:hypothetical protein
MRRLRYVGLGIVILAAAGIGLYYFLEYDPDAPRADWPVLQAAAPAADAAQVVVGRNVHVSASLGEFRYHECVIAADPADPTRLFASAMHWRGNDVDIAGFYSRDGGATWQLGCERVAQPGKRLCDPSVAFGPDGSVYMVYLRSDPNSRNPLGTEGAEGLDFLVSPDGGKTWEERAKITRDIDRPWIAVDTTTGPGRSRLYCIGNVDEPIFYSSADGAKTLAPPLTPLAGRKLVNCRPGNPVVMADGTVLLVYEDRHARSGTGRHRPRLLTLRSIDGGRTLTECARVNTNWWHDTVLSSKNSVAGVEFPQLAADPGSPRFADRVYCVWMDGTNHEGMRIFFSGSPDRGTTWSQPVVVSEQPMQGGADGEYITFMPSVAVNKDGVVAVSWYDRRGLPKSMLVPMQVEGVKPHAYKLVAEGWNVRLRVSLDGGATWLPTVQVNEQPGRGEIDVGHTAGLAAGADGRFHPAWIDNRTGKNQLWTAAVEVRVDK